MPHNGKETLEKIKLRKEIEKIELEQVEIKRSTPRFIIALLCPVIIAIASATVIIKSDLFKDLEAKNEIATAKFKMDTIEFSSKKQKILAIIEQLTIDTLKLHDDNVSLKKKNFYLDSVYRKYQMNGGKTLQDLNTLILNLKNDNTFLRKDTTGKNALAQLNLHYRDSIGNFWKRDKEGVLAFQMNIKQYLWAHEIRTNRDQLDLITHIEEAAAQWVPGHINSY